MNKCTQDWPHPYPDQDNRLWTMSDFRGKTVVMAFGQYG
jgi:peroxiredoxin